MVYQISYDLKKPGQDYSGLFEAIKSLGSWWHYLESSWLVDTHYNASQIFERVKGHIDQNDLILIIGVTNDYAGWLPQKAWDWIKSRQLQAA